jgi:hypothetical protein
LNSDIGLDLEPMRIPTIVGEELTLSLASKKVADVEDARLRISLAGFDDADAHVGDFFIELLDPGMDAYEEFSFDFTVPESVASVNVAFRIWDGVFDSWFDGAYLIDDVSLMGPAGSGDFDGDGDIDGNDFLVWQQGGSPNPLSTADLEAWRTAFGMVAGTEAVMTAVPEPASLLQIVAVGLMLLARKRGGECKS